MTSTWDYNNSYELRLEMVAEQLKYRGIVKDDILRAFTEVPRHLFIPHVPIQDSYGDHPIPIPAGQTISQPFIVALMIDYLELEVDHTVLEIGSGSGYATAILAKLCRYVDAYEVYSELIRGSQSAHYKPHRQAHREYRLIYLNPCLMGASSWLQKEKDINMSGSIKRVVNN